MNKIVLVGLRDIKTDEKIEPNIDYGVFLVASRISEEKMDTFTDEEPDDIKYKLKISHIDNIVALKDAKEVKFKSGQSDSQKWRWIVEQKTGEYNHFMQWMFANQDKIIESYLDTLTLKSGL